jgi:hypothetical protein
MDNEGKGRIPLTLFKNIIIIDISLGALPKSGYLDLTA